MLKIWKQAWKKEDSTRKPQSGEDSDQLGGTSSGGPSSVDVSAAVPPNSSDSTLVPVESHGKKRLRTGHGEDGATNDSADPPPKKSRTETRDSLRDHLPEIIGSDGPACTPFSSAGFEEQVLDQAKLENTIGVLTSARSATKILADFLTWADEFERSRPIPTLQGPRRAALLVVDEDTSVDSQASTLKDHCTLTTGTYAVSLQSPNLNPWPDLLQQDIIIIRANELLDCLLREFLTISQFHVLIISDAQLVKDQDSHPIVRVMNDFYRITDSIIRPKILAMATIPANRKFHFDSGMLKLEDTLDAKVFGISDDQRTEILALPDRPNELVVPYDPPLRTTETRLFRELRQYDQHEVLFRRHFQAARNTLTEVGSCASDLIWRRALKEIEDGMSPMYEEDEDGNDQSGMSPARRKARIRDIVKNWAFAMPNLHSGSRGFNITPKFLKLIKILKSCQPYGDSFRGIVFVQKRATAQVLVDLIRTLGDHLGFIRPSAIVGHHSSPESEQDIFRAFAKGSCNLLIATKSAEDLDVPKASLVIRFDLFESHVSNAYVRARTRGRESHLVFMVEKGNDVHRRILSQITDLDTEVRRWTEAVCTSPGSSIPPSTLRETINPYLSDSEDEEEPGTFVKDPTTSGRIRSQDATTALYRYAARRTQVDWKVRDHPLFEFKEMDGSFGLLRTYVCSIALPGSPVDKMSGQAWSSMAHARRAACYQACVELSRQGLLDYTLFPLSSSIASPNGSQESSDKDSPSTGAHCYPRKPPDFWVNTGSAALGGCLYPTVIFTNNPSDTSQPHSPIIIITRLPLPEFPPFKVFFSGVAATVHFTQAAPFTIDDKRLHDLHMYTIRLCRAISNRPFVCPLESMPYFFAPLRPSWQEDIEVDMEQDDRPNIVNHIPWDQVSLAAKSWVVALRTENLAEDIADAVIQDRWVEFTRRYDAVRVRPDLNPLSKPADSLREAEYDNLVEYCKARRKDFEGLQDYTQPLIEVSKIPAVLNRLNATSRPLTVSMKHPAKYLIPELCAKFTIPASVLRPALLLPSITRRLDDFLIVKELNAKFFDHSIAERHLHAAISTPSAGIEFDYERLELLGDAFLKYLSSIYVFVTNPAQHEGALHVSRQKIISNKSLLQNACRTGLPPYIQAKPFTVRLWQPPNFAILPNPGPPSVKEGNKEGEIMGEVDDAKPADASTSAQDPNPVPPSTVAGGLTTQGESIQSVEPEKPKKKSKKQKQQDEQNIQMLGDKAVADVAEAIIGAAYISGGREAALRASKALSIPIPHIDRWSDFGRKVLAPPPDVTAKLRPGSIEAVEGIIGHKFSRPHLLAQALTHASIQGHETTSYERLEFIGDAILDFMVIRYIFDRDSSLSPGGLTLLKGAMVANSTLAALSVWSGLHQHLLFESYSLATNMQAYADQLKLKQTQEYELAEKEGRSPGQYWLEIEPPKALSDVVESIIGAVYISDNFSPDGAETLFDNVLKPFYDRHITLKTLSHHPTKILFELFQAQGCQQFQIIKDKEHSTTRCDVIVHDVILSSAIDTTVTFAARRASLFALDALEGDAEFLTRTCDCRTHSQSKKAQKKGLEKALKGLEDDEEQTLGEDERTQAEEQRGMVSEVVQIGDCADPE